jgi:hypothetical protein
MVRVLGATLNAEIDLSRRLAADRGTRQVYPHSSQVLATSGRCHTNRTQPILAPSRRRVNAPPSCLLRGDVAETFGWRPGGWASGWYRREIGQQDKILRGVPIHNYRMAKTLG